MSNIVPVSDFPITSAQGYFSHFQGCRDVLVLKRKQKANEKEN